jgi:hypothetical protein
MENYEKRNNLKTVKAMLIIAAILEAAYLIFNAIDSSKGSGSTGFSDALQYTGLGLMIAIAAVFRKDEPVNREKTLWGLGYGLAAILYLEVATSMRLTIKIAAYYGTSSSLGMTLFGNIDGFLEAFFVLALILAMMDKSLSLYKVALVTGFITLACEALFGVATVYSLTVGGGSAYATIWSTLSTICYGPCWVIFEGAWLIYLGNKIKEYSK